MKSKLINHLQERDLIKDCTNLEGLDEMLANGKKLAVYAGFDPTAQSLHVGHLTTLRMLRIFRDFGHTVIPVIGEFTAKVGDPTGRDETRPVLTDDMIKRNSDGIAGNIMSVINPSLGIKTNKAWLSLISLESLLIQGREITINRMLHMESVASRLQNEQPMTFTEFCYGLLQAYDFLYLYGQFIDGNIEGLVQIGGSDQYGNILLGCDWIRRKHGQNTAFGLTHPLLTTPDGRKMGKTEGNAVWLNASMCKPFDFWQFWRNIDDSMVDTVRRRFTDLPKGSGDINEQKAIVATEITALVHGEEEATKIVETAKNVFGRKTDNLSGLPTIRVKKAINVPTSAFLKDHGVCESKSAANRLIEQNGIKINDVPAGHAINLETDFKLSVGKKKHWKVEVE